jgi:hypothetical protein
MTYELLSRAGVCVGSTCFSGAEDLSDSIDDYMKDCHIRIIVGCVWRVDQVFSSRMYIDSNRRDSWI